MLALFESNIIKLCIHLKTKKQPRKKEINIP